MQLYRVKKGDKVCYVTPMMFIEYKRKGWQLLKKIESRPGWTKEDLKRKKALDRNICKCTQ